ncbi:PREDICTED: aluminum-activated malate transporter 10-like [Ipomoea nil]|uniref:aluminum-activated malate transporter 10-like n=1 Tax=Ipomoea nil TaxID=35883 RepID=UPI0009009785|nr:PREDICTED: aluminum-activated malate transporter 10-like [Ipomoea nil]
MNNQNTTKVAEGSSEVLPPQTSKLGIIWMCLIDKTVFRLWRFFMQAWDIGCKEPRKVIHGLKVGIALSVVSLFYYMRPLYDGVGGTAMWAVLTVVIVFEYTVGATISKCLNRIMGTFLAGFLALGIHWFASKLGAKMEAVIAGTSVFLLVSAATFSRFIPSVKKRFEYGTMIFILTFSLVSISGYRVEELFTLAHRRVSTIIIGTSLCTLSTMLIFPVWAGEELHLLITSNLDKLANSLDCCVAEYFDDCGETSKSSQESAKSVAACRSVLNSKNTEDTMANFARWEPAHGQFNFQHPWKQYLKIGASIRACACCIETLHSCINQETKGSETVKKALSEACKELGSRTSSILRELASEIKTGSTFPRVDILIQEKDSAIQELQERLKSISVSVIPRPPSSAGTKLFQNEEEKDSDLAPAASCNAAAIPLAEAIPVVAFASLTMEVAMRIEGVVTQVKELARLAKFKAGDSEMPKQNQCSNV